MFINIEFLKRKFTVLVQLLWTNTYCCCHKVLSKKKKKKNHYRWISRLCVLTLLTFPSMSSALYSMILTKAVSVNGCHILWSSRVRVALDITSKTRKNTSFCRWGNWGPKMWSNLNEFTQFEGKLVEDSLLIKWLLLYKLMCCIVHFNWCLQCKFPNLWKC